MALSAIVAMLFAGTALRIFATAEAPAPAGSGPAIALVGGLIRTQTDAGDFVGTIIVQGGKITALGPTVAIPADARRIDVANHVITSGLIDARSVLWLNSGAAKEGGREGALNILDGVDPYAEDWREVARQGVTAVYVQPAGSGSLGGSGAVLRVGQTTTVDELVLKSLAGVQAALGVSAPPAPAVTERPTGFAGRFGFAAFQAPAATPPSPNALTRYAQYEALRGQFDAAKRYGESKPAHPDPAKEVLVKAIKREIPVRLEVSHEDDLRNSIKFLTDLNLRAIFEHVHRAQTVPEEWSAAKAGLVVGPLYGGKKSAAVRKLALDGRRWAIGTYGDEPRTSAWLRAHAAAAVADGYPRDQVLRALTHDAAELLGVADKLGSLAIGRIADLVVFAGDPLDPSVSIRITMSQGVITYESAAADPAPVSVARETQVDLPEQLPPSYILKTKRILTPTGEFTPGEVYVADGKFMDRGAVSLSVPVFDLGEAVLTPGLVAAHVSVGGEQTPDADASHLRGSDALASNDARIRGYRDGGFLTVVAAPGSRNVLAGLATCAPRPQPLSPEGRGVGERGTEVGLKFVLTAAARNNERYPASLVGQVEFIGDRLRGMPSQTNWYLPTSVAQALLAERERNLNAVRTGRLAAYFEAQSPTEIRAALRLITAHKLRGVLLEPKPAEDLSSEIRAAGAAVVIGPLRPQDSERIGRTLAELGKAGVPFAFGSGDAAELRTTSAWLVNTGLPRPAARRALIAQPPEAFGLPVSRGRMQSGDAADFVIWNGDPLDPGNRPLAAVSQGQRLGIGK